MSGILGLYHLDRQSINAHVLQQMVERLMHRGPDGNAIWVNGHVGFGHRMLWTTPESLFEQLPLVQGSLTITADARIDNRDELADVLALPDRPLEKIADSEFILAAYQKWGEACADHLLGDFAFAIWDHDQQTLFCARDHFGVKPFYYCTTQDVFAFASEIKALFCLPHMTRQLNAVRIGDFLTLAFDDKVITTYQDIVRLPPASCLRVSAEGIQTWTYWQLDPDRTVQFETDEAYAQTFRHLFIEAVHCRLRSAFPIGSHLSGGLDSSSVTCVARDLLAQGGQALHTLSLIFDAVPECDERAYIQPVLEQSGYIPHSIHGDRLGQISDLSDVLDYEDEALTGPSYLYPWNLNQVCQEQGIRVCLDGFDGDTVVDHGTTRFAELASQGQWVLFHQEAIAICHHFSNYGISLNGLVNAYALPCLQRDAIHWRWITVVKTIQQLHRHFAASRRSLLKYALLSAMRAPLQRWQKMWKRTPKDLPGIALVRQEFAEQIHLATRLQHSTAAQANALTVREAHWRRLSDGVLPFTLEQIDRFGARFAVESRHPFMDKRLVEFCLSVPSVQKMHHGWTRMILRRAMEGILPETVQWRGGKNNATPNFIDGLLNRDRAHLDAVFNSKLFYLEPFVDLEVVKNAYEQLTDKERVSNDTHSMQVWQAVSLTLWLERHQIAP